MKIKSSSAPKVRRVRKEADRKAFRKVRRERIASKHSFLA
jgi:hypothetical protein